MAIPKTVINRLKTEVPRFQKILISASDRDVNEADTVIIVADILSDVFGMDKYSDITREFAIKGTFVDLAIKIDNKIEYLIEVKSIGSTLNDTHLRQAINYAAKEGVQWVVLTNGITWQIHRITISGSVKNDKVAQFNFLELSTRSQQDLEMLFLLCKKGLSKDLISDFYERQQACNKNMIAAVIQTDATINTIRRTLRAITPGLKVTSEEVLEVLQKEVIKRDTMLSEEGQKATKKVKRELAKIERKKTAVKKKTVTNQSA